MPRKRRDSRYGQGDYDMRIIDWIDKNVLAGGKIDRQTSSFINVEKMISAGASVEDIIDNLTHDEFGANDDEDGLQNFILSHRKDSIQQMITQFIEKAADSIQIAKEKPEKYEDVEEALDDISKREAVDKELIRGKVEEELGPIIEKRQELIGRYGKNFIIRDTFPEITPKFEEDVLGPMSETLGDVKISANIDDIQTLNKQEAERAAEILRNQADILGKKRMSRLDFQRAVGDVRRYGVTTPLREDSLLWNQLREKGEKFNINDLKRLKPSKSKINLYRTEEHLRDSIDYMYGYRMREL